MFVKVIFAISMATTLQTEGTDTASEKNVHDLMLDIFLSHAVLNPGDFLHRFNKRKNIYHIMYIATG